MPALFDLQGHRGARGLKPENTLPSFEAALDCGVTSVETDVHLTHDAVPVLWHDPVLPDGSLVASLPLSKLRQATLNRVVAAFPSQDAVVTPLARWYGEQHGLHPFALQTVADLFRFTTDYAGEAGRLAGKSDEQRAKASRVVFDLELKRVPYYPQTIGDNYTGDGPGLLEERVVEAIRAADIARRTRVRGFDHRCVRFVRKMEPAVTGVVIIADTAPIDPGDLALRADATFYGPSWEFVDAGQVRAAHAAGVRVLPWTANSPDQWRRLLDFGVDGITTDYPDRLARFLQEAGVAY
jgi:glycerophosphoryl diester phosphodiesterase